MFVTGIMKNNNNNTSNKIVKEYGGKGNSGGGGEGEGGGNNCESGTLKCAICKEKKGKNKFSKWEYEENDMSVCKCCHNYYDNNNVYLLKITFFILSIISTNEFSE